MACLEFTHSDMDGDKLTVTEGVHGAVFEAVSTDGQQVKVVVREAYLRDLVLTLQTIGNIRINEGIDY